MEKTTIHDVAKRAEVSVTTVSRVLNNRGYISDATRKKVQNAIGELGFIPNEMARSFYTTSSRLVGLIIPTIANPFFGEIAYYVEKALSRLQYKLLVCNSINEKENEKEYLRMLQENRVDGIIVGSHNINIEEYDKMPLKMVSLEGALHYNSPLVQCDNYQGGYIASQALVDAGCRQILCIAGDPKLDVPSNSRHIAYQECMKKNGLSHHIRRIPFTYDDEQKYLLIDEFFQEGAFYDGVFASDDVLASMVYNYALSKNISIPQDLKLVGFDGTDVICTVQPALSTIRQPIKEIAETSVKILLDLIADKPVPPKTILPVQFLRRQSLG